MTQHLSLLLLLLTLFMLMVLLAYLIYLLPQWRNLAQQDASKWLQKFRLLLHLFALLTLSSSLNAYLSQASHDRATWIEAYVATSLCLWIAWGSLYHLYRECKTKLLSRYHPDTPPASASKRPVNNRSAPKTGR
ncbi:hypothetical protein LVJ82_02850 [Vitreoscilla massiliensis]|uniref:DUF3325 domain-containing protein n=1 Tax=Vitreoscilla massiliensis TaxID=1689272 RepID=A0ABY4E3S8_9NEIS|nr:hypothetical protein [Vitreoscilla massiliensis]UOO89944.1 hypothetical protein LVJ82_02850 [Vitreoscilla massiliensis]